MGRCTALIETSWGSTTWDPWESSVLGKTGVPEGLEGAGGVGGTSASSWGLAAPACTQGFGRSWLGLECLQVLEVPASQLQPPRPPNSIAKHLLSALCHLSWLGGAEGTPLSSIPPVSFVKMSLRAQHWWRKCGIPLFSLYHDLKPY